MTNITRRAAFGGIAAVAAGAAGTADAVTTDDVAASLEMAVAASDGVLPAEDRFRYHLAYAAKALAELRQGTAKYDGELLTLGGFLLGATPAVRRVFYCKSLAEVLSEMRPGAWRYRVDTDNCVATFVKDGPRWDPWQG